MKGLIFNILSELSERAGCQDDAWEVALAGAALGDDEYELGDELDGDPLALVDGDDIDFDGLEADDALELEAFEMPYLDGEWGDSFRFLLRSAGPYSEGDWAHLPGTPVSFGAPSERRTEPSGERGSFRPEGDTADPYAILMRSLASAKR